MCDPFNRVFLVIVGRQPIVFRRHERLEIPPRVTRDGAQFFCLRARECSERAVLPGAVSLDRERLGKGSRRTG